METSASFGAWMRRQRKALDLTQQALADRVGYSVATLKKIEAGERRPSREMAERLAEYLAIPSDHRQRFVESARGVRPVDGHALAAAPASLPGPVSNLPSPLTPLIGRKGEIAAVKQVLLQPDTRLLTITGPPGIGKTRLSIQVASEVCPEFEENAYFVALAPLTTPDLIPTAIAQTLGISQSEARSPLVTLINYILSKPLLLVLDNFEHLLAAAPMVVELLQACPRLKVLATSRSPLNVSGEHQYPLSTLLLPEPAQPLSPESLAEYPSIALFVSRAQAANPRFSLNEDNALAVAEICSKLDGLPLAIELAAAHSKLLKPQELLTRLNHRFSLLSGGPVDLPARQRTLRAAIDWSFNLLVGWEQTLFSRLAVFLGGWTLEAAEAVASEGHPDLDDAREVFSALSGLVDKSLVQKNERNEVKTRFSMLESIREFALEKLEQSGELEAIRKRHSAYFSELAEVSESALRGPEQLSWLAKLDEEHNNLRAALQWNLDRDDTETAVKLAGALWRYWWMHGYYGEGRIWLEKALERAETSPTPWRARALNGAGILARSQDDYAAAQEYLQASLQIQESLGDWAGVANALNSLGVLAYVQGGNAQAASFHEQSLAYRRKIDDRRGIAISLNNLALIAQETERLDEAEGLFRQCLDLFLELGDLRGISAARANLGYIMLARGSAAEADAFFREALGISKSLRQRDDIIECLEGLAGVASLEGRPDSAARLLGIARALRGSMGLSMHSDKQIWQQRLVQDIEAQLLPDALEAEQAIGRELTLDRAIEYALHGLG